MQACIQNDELTPALHIFHTFVKLHHRLPGAPTITSLIALCTKHCAFSDGHAVVKGTPVDKLQAPTLQAYLALMEAEITDKPTSYENTPTNNVDECSYDKALSLVKSVGKIEDVGSSILFRLAASSPSINFVDKFSNILQEVRSVGEIGPKARAAAIRHLPPSHEEFDKLLYARPVNEVVFCAAIASLSDSHDREKAVQVLESMPSFNLVADVTCYNAALRALVKADQPELCQKLLTNLKNDGLQSDNATCAVVRAALRRPTFQANLGTGEHAVSAYNRWWRKCGWPDPDSSLIDLHNLPSHVALSLAQLVVSKLKAEHHAGLPPREVIFIPGQGIHSDVENEPILKPLLLARLQELGVTAHVLEHNQGRVRVSVSQCEDDNFMTESA